MITSGDYQLDISSQVDAAEKERWKKIIMWHGRKIVRNIPADAKVIFWIIAGNGQKSMPKCHVANQF